MLILTLLLLCVQLKLCSWHLRGDVCWRCLLILMYHFRHTADTAAVSWEHVCCVMSVYVWCVCWVYMLGGYVECACWVCMLSVHVGCVCWVCMLSVYVECTCWVCMLSVRVECASQWTVLNTQLLCVTDECINSLRVWSSACHSAKWYSCNVHCRCELSLLSK